MAPAISATSPAPAHRQPPSRRPMRIVPAVPLRLSRAPRPVTPEDSGKDVQVVPQIDLFSRHPNRSRPPLTPDSRASTNDDGPGDAVALLNSPAYSQRGEAVHEPTQSNQSDSIDFSNAVLTELKPATNGTDSKLAIPSQLPPPFYPASKAESHTPSAHGSDRDTTTHHQLRLSATAETFHLVGDSPAVPNNPKNLGYEALDQQTNLFPRPQPGFAPPPFTPPFLADHPHHPSDTIAPWSYSHLQKFPDEPSKDHGPSLHVTSGPAASEACLSSFSGPFHRNPVSYASNDAGASRSSSPDKPLYVVGDDVGGEFPTMPNRNFTTTHFEPLDDSPIALAAYLSTQFANPDFSDLLLQLHAPGAIHISLPAHGIVVARSPVIAESMHRSAPASNRPRETPRLVDVGLSDPFITHESIEEAIRVLYGAPILSPRTFLHGLPPYVDALGQRPNSDECRRRMQQLISYIAAGRALRIPTMQSRGVHILCSLIRWDTVDLALHFGVQSYTGSKTGQKLEDPLTAAMLDQAIDFVAFSIPVDFSLYALAPEMKNMARIPISVESRPTTHNPRLSRIRFGDAPPEETPQLSDASHVLSSILLTLPLALVDRLLNHRATANRIGWTGVVKVMRDVIDERENRRQKALRGYIRSLQDGQSSNSLEDILFAEERVQETEVSAVHPSGHKLVANHTTPQVRAKRVPNLGL